MIWTITASALALALVAVAGFARAAARAGTAPQPTSAPILAGDIGPACLACRPGWEPARILGSYTVGDSLIIRTVGPDGTQTGLVIPADVPEALDAFVRLLALDGPPTAPDAIASSITARRAGTVIAIRATQEVSS